MVFTSLRLSNPIDLQGILTHPILYPAQPRRNATSLCTLLLFPAVVRSVMMDRCTAEVSNPLERKSESSSPHPRFSVPFIQARFPIITVRSLSNQHVLQPVGPSLPFSVVFSGGFFWGFFWPAPSQVWASVLLKAGQMQALEWCV